MNIFTTLLSAALLAATVVRAEIEDIQGTVSISGRNAIAGEEGIKGRAWSLEYFPATKPRVFLGKGISGQGDFDLNQATGEFSGEGTFDAAGVWVNTLAAADIGFAYFGGEAKIEGISNQLGQATPESNDTATAAVEGSLDVSAFGFGLMLGHIFEYEDENDNDQYDHGEENITGWYHLRHLWRDWGNGIVCESVGAAELRAHSCVIGTKDGVFKMRLTVTGELAELGSVMLTPQKVKVDFEINWFNAGLSNCDFDKYPGICGFLPGRKGPSDSSTAKIGLTALGISKSGTATANAEFTEGSGAVQFTSEGGSIGVFEWLKNATTTVNGTTEELGVHVNELDECPEEYQYANDVNVILNRESAKPGTGYAKFLIFSFAGERPDLIVYDPTMGAESISESDEPESTAFNPGGEIPVENADSAAKCVAADSQVDVLTHGGVVERRAASSLRSGDRVRALSADGSRVEFSPVVANVHVAHEERSALLRLAFASGAAVRASPNHMIRCDGAEVEAKYVTVGQQCAVVREDGALAHEAVASVQRVAAARVVAPVTESGYVVVDGVACSSFSGFEIFSWLRIGHGVQAALIPFAAALNAAVPRVWDQGVGAAFAHHFVKLFDMNHFASLSKLASTSILSA